MVYLLLQQHSCRCNWCGWFFIDDQACEGKIFHFNLYIASVIQEVQRITKDKGLFYVSITHPAFYDGEWLCDENGYKSAKVMENYLSEMNYDNEFWGKTKHYHRPLSTYLNLFCDHHFRLVHMEEPRIYDNTKQSSEIPLFIMMEFEKLK